MFCWYFVSCFFFILSYLHVSRDIIWNFSKCFFSCLGLLLLLEFYFLFSDFLLLHFSFQCISDSVLSAKTYFNSIRWLTREKFNWFLEIVIGILLYNLLFWWHYYVRDYLLKHLEITSIVEPIIIITIIIIMLFQGNKMEEEPTRKRKILKQIHSDDIFDNIIVLKYKVTSKWIMYIIRNSQHDALIMKYDNVETIWMTPSLKLLFNFL